MATYYVRTDGSNSNAGTGPATNQAWQTVTYALANMVLTNGTNYLYIAPGAYRGSATLSITPSSTQTLVISGDPTAAQFSGVSAGMVRITNFTSDTANPSNSTLLTISGKTYTTIQNIAFDFYSTSQSNFCINAQSNCDYVTISNCVFTCHDTGGAGWAVCPIRIVTSTTVNSFTIDRCLFTNPWVGVYFSSTAVSNTTQNVSVTRCQFFGGDFDISFDGNGLGRTVYNCTHCFNDRQAITSTVGQTGATSVYNCLFYRGSSALVGPAMVENYNRFISTNARTNVSPSGANSVSGGVAGLDFGYGLLTGMANQQMVSSLIGQPNYNFGTSTGAPATDLYGVTWNNNIPDAGAATYRSLSSVGSYIPTDRNASTITIAPGSTSQSIELYLGATGLTASTAGLSAYYNRTRSADVQINLQARNITQAWTSGGFAEVNPNTMPGVYRLDIPNEALAAGADDVTVVVRGASGTNGAVMSIKLSSGGLTSAQTASAVWDATYTSHTAANSFGARSLLTTVDNRPVTVGSSQHIHSNIHAIVDSTIAADELSGALLHNGTDYIDSDVVRISTSTAAANELEGALLHNGTDYIDSNLIGGAATRVFVGRFQMTQTGTTQGDIIEAFTTDTPAFELQLFDGDNNLVPVTGATLGLRILDVTSTVVETGTPTIEYGTGGIVRWAAPGTYLSIGCPAGMYRLFVDRTVSGTTTTFGPLQIKVQVQ